MKIIDTAPPQDAPTTQHEAEFLGMYRAMDAEDRDVVFRLAAAFLDRSRKERRNRPALQVIAGGVA